MSCKDINNGHNHALSHACVFEWNFKAIMQVFLCVVVAALNISVLLDITASRILFFTNYFAR